MSVKGGTLPVTSLLGAHCTTANLCTAVSLRAGPTPLSMLVFLPASSGEMLRSYWGTVTADTRWHALVSTASPRPLVFQNTQCIPEGLESYYTEQDSSAREKFYTVINHYNLAKQSITRSVSPWMSVLSEEKLSEQETEAAEKSA